MTPVNTFLTVFFSIIIIINVTFFKSYVLFCVSWSLLLCINLFLHAGYLPKICKAYDEYITCTTMIVILPC